MSKTKIPCSELPWGLLPPPSSGLSSHFCFSNVPCRTVSWDESEHHFQTVLLLHLAPTKQPENALLGGGGMALNFLHTLPRFSLFLPCYPLRLIFSSPPDISSISFCSVSFTKPASTPSLLSPRSPSQILHHKIFVASLRFPWGLDILSTLPV